MFAFTLHGHPMMWCFTLHDAFSHSFDQLVGELTRAFYQYDHKALNKKIMELQIAPDESVMQFWERFRNLLYQIPEYEIDWVFLDEIFQYLLHIYENLHMLESFEPLPTYLGVRDEKY